MKINRNESCPCGSGKKYKKCCLDRPVATETVSDDWQKMRKTEGKLVEQLLTFAFKKYSKEVIAWAWYEFLGFPDVRPNMNDEKLIAEFAFSPWLLFNWLPDPMEDTLSHLEEITAAEAYLARYGQRLSSYEKTFLKANIDAHYSLYEVVHVVPQRSLTLKDILRNKKITVHERLGTEMLRIGDIIMARVITIADSSICIGMYPMSLPAEYLISIVDFKQHYAPKKAFTDEMLFDLDIEIRGVFIELIKEASTIKMPHLQNTDGEDVVIQDVHFTLKCTIKEALSELVDLAIEESEATILQNAMYDKNNQLVEVTLPWCKQGNAVHKTWQNTVLGTIKIKQDELIINVNSNERAARVRSEIEKRLKDKALYRVTAIQSLEEVLSKQKQAQTSVEDDINQLPEVKARLKKIHDEFWQSWLDMEIPALDNKTPRKASKTKRGKEKLEALFETFHANNLSRKSQFPIDLKFLRDALGMS